MILFIPLATGQAIAKQIFKSISDQSIDMNIVPCVSDGVITRNRFIEERKKKTEGETNSRNIAIDIFKQHYKTENFFFMQDSDIVHEDSGNYLKCVEFLRTNLSHGAVALPWKGYEVKDHIRMMAFVMRSELIQNGFHFRYDDKYHTCATMKEDIEKMGYKYEFLPSNKKLITELFQGD
jgi:hypothetical protein